MHRPLAARLLVWLFALLPLVSAGCSTGGRGGSPFSLFPQGHRLLDDTKDLRWANAGPLQIPRELEKQPLPTYIVEPGDVLLVQPSNLDSPARLPGDQPVLPDGTINLGQYGHLLVAGKTVPEIQGMVQSAVVTQTKDAGYITVRLVSRVSKVFYVLGEVNSPGSFPLSGRETVLDGICAAGNLTRSAALNKAILVRPSHPDGCREVLPVCLQQIVQLGDTSTNYQLRPGDRIYIPSQGMLESLFPTSKKTTGPCCKQHTPCYTGGGGGCGAGGCGTDPTAATMPTGLTPGGGIPPITTTPTTTTPGGIPPITTMPLPTASGGGVPPAPLPPH